MHRCTLFLAGVVRALLCWTLAVLSWALPGNVLAQGGISVSSYFEDTQGTLTFEQVRERTFQTFQLPLQRGYTSSTFWVRLTLTPQPGQSNMPWVIRIRPSYLDEVALYDPLLPNGTVVRTGDRHPLPQGGYRSLNHSLLVPQGNEPRDVWLRLQTTSTTLLYVDMLTLGEATSRDLQQELTVGLVLGAMLPFLLIAVINHRAARDGVSLLLILNQLAGLVYCLFVFGIARFALDNQLAPQWLDWLTSLVVIGTVTANCAFNLMFLKVCKGGWRPVLWIAPVLGVCLLNLLLFLAGHVQLALNINALCVLALPASCLLAIVSPSIPNTGTASESGQVFSRSQLLLMYLPIAAMGWFIALALLGLVPSTPAITLMIQPAYYFMSVMVAVFGVVYRTRVMQQAQEIGQMRLAAAEREADLQRERAQAQNRLLSMLTHEIRTPLSLLRIAIGWLDNRPQIRAQAEAAVRDLNEVISGVSLMQRIENKAMVPQRERLAPAIELIQLTQAQPACHRIQTDLDGCPETIGVDRWLMRTILRNLLDNALRYSPGGSPVDVKARQQIRAGVAGLCVTVTNAIDASARPDPDKLFTQFYRGPGSQRLTGSGLGLFIARELATTLRGELSFRFEPEGSIQFSLWLPL